MATHAANQRELIDALNSLVELDFDAVEAYRAAIDRLTTASDKAQLSLFMEDHVRHIAELTPIIERMGGVAASAADLKQVLTKGKVMLAGLVGDAAILRAMRSNEGDTNIAYERAVSRVDLSPAVRTILQRALADERRHRGWLEQRLVFSEAAAAP